MKKATISDVAAIANVCKATVSYVLNDKQDQKISEDTKKRIWQAVNLLNYKPNIFARNLRGNQSMRTVAICYSDSLSALAKLSTFELIENITSTLKANGNSTVLLSCEPQKVDSADAIVSIGISKEHFYRMGDANFVPLIALNTIIQDPLFYDVAIDYNLLSATAERSLGEKYTYVCTTPCDSAISNAITTAIDNVVFINDFADIAHLPQGKLLVTDKTIADMLSTNDILYINMTDLLVEQILKCIQFALSHENIDTHNYRV